MPHHYFIPSDDPAYLPSFILIGQKLQRFLLTVNHVPVSLFKITLYMIQLDIVSTRLKILLSPTLTVKTDNVNNAR